MMTEDEQLKAIFRLEKRIKESEKATASIMPAPFYWETKQGRKEMTKLRFQYFLAQLMALAFIAAVVFLFLALVSGCQAYREAHPKQIVVTVCADDGSECKTMKGTEK